MSRADVKKKQIELYSHIVWILIILFIGREIGSNGLTYVLVPFFIISLVSSLFFDNSTSITGTMFRSRIIKGHVKNATLLFRNMLIFSTLLSIILIVFLNLIISFLATSFFRIPYMIILFRILSPVLLFRVLSGIFLGYFHGNNFNLVSVLSIFIRRFFFLILCSIFVSIAINYGTKVSALLQNENIIGMYGGIGGASAILISEILVFLFIVIIYFSKRNKFKKQDDGNKKNETFIEQIQIFYMLSKESIFVKSFLYFIPILSVILFNSYMEQVSVVWGTYYGKVILLIFLPICLVLARCLQLRTFFGIAKKNNDIKYMKQIVATGIHFISIVGIFWMIILLGLSEKIANAFWGKDLTNMSNLLFLSSPLPLLITFCGYFFYLLYMQNEKRKFALLTIIAIVVYIISTCICMILVKDVLAVTYSTIISLVIIIIVSIIMVRKTLKVRIDWNRFIVFPSILGSIVLVIVVMIRNLISPHMNAVLVLLIGILLTLILYLAGLSFLRNIKENEIKMLFQGKLSKILIPIFK